jgi:PKHD-type hydroxylase
MDIFCLMQNINKKTKLIFTNQLNIMSQQFHHIPALLSAEDIKKIEDHIAETEFIDGKATATMAAKEVKNNLQLKNDGSGKGEQIQELLTKAINANPYFQVASQPKKVHPFIISKYTTGKFYGWHVDSPLMGDPIIRTDLAMTVFLSDPNSYEGGELMIQTSAGSVGVKPAKGDAILYPCEFLHCVNEIKSGERLAAVTWIQSNIQSPDQRAILFDLNRIHASMQQNNSPESNLMLQTYSNLFRMWADV